MGSFFSGAILVLLILVTSPSQAALLSLDFRTDSDGLITQDSLSGLDWLDLTVTQGMSWAFVESLITDDPAFQGFRFAQREEVEGFVVNAGGVLPSIHPLSENYLPISSLMEFVGVTQTISSTYAISRGILSPLSGMSDGPYGQSRNRFSLVTYGNAGQVAPYDGTQKYNETSVYTGSWLVRASTASPVPNPPAFVLMLTGLTVLGAMRRYISFKEQTS